MLKAHKARIIEAKNKWYQVNKPELIAPCWAYPNGMTFSTYDKSDTSTNGLTSCIIDFVNWSGHFAERINTQGQARVRRIVDGNNGKQIGNRTNGVTFTPTTGVRGSADIAATIRRSPTDEYGVPVKIEVKFGKDRQSDHQKRYEDLTTASGGVYIIVRTFEDFIEWYDSFTDRI